MITNFSCSLSYIEKAEDLRPGIVVKSTDQTNIDGVVKVRIQGKSILTDNIVTSDDEHDEKQNDAKQIQKTEIIKTSSKIDESKIENLILTSLQKIVANKVPLAPKKPAVTSSSGTANKTIARRSAAPRAVSRNNAGSSSRPLGNRNDGGNTRGNIAPLNRNFGNNGNSMSSDFGISRNLSFGNDLGNNMGGNLNFGANLRGNSSFDNMRGLSNSSDFNSDFSSIGMRRSNVLGLNSNLNSMGSNGRGFDNMSGMGMSGGSNFNSNWGNGNNSNGGGGGGGFNNSWGNGNLNRF